MCGIVGVIGITDRVFDLTGSLEHLSKRGPDRQASLHIGHAQLGHCRLSIIDTTSKADQPMQDPSGRYVLVFNGEIYNYRTIADTLRKKGVEFKSQSDTEVVLHLLINEGSQGLKKLNGFFALAFYDLQSDKAIIARDRMGIKPLYIKEEVSSIYFSSELKGLMSLGIDYQIDKTAVSLFFRFNYIPQGCSIFKGVRQLDPGHYIQYDRGQLNERCYLELDEEKHFGTLSSLLEDSVKLRLISDVPLGSFLSGGVDSSIIAALAAKHAPGIQTFSIGFKDAPHFDESHYAEKVARHIGSEHRTIQLHEDEMLQHVDLLLEYTDEPFADSSAIAVHALSHYTREHVTVALSGDGADELFGGYNKHQAHLAALAPSAKERLGSWLGQVSKGLKGSHSSISGNFLRKIQRYGKGAELDFFDRYWAWASWTDEEEVEKLLQFRPDDRYRHILESLGPTDGTVEEVLIADTRSVLPSDMLTKVDRMSMANSLEVRVPFLDHRVVSYAHGLSAEQRFARGRGKFILQQEFGHLLPSEIFERKKKGFEVPLEKWFLGPLRAKMEEVLKDEVLKDSGLFDPGYLNTLNLRLTKGHIGDRVHLLWALMVFHRFYSRYGY